MKWNPRVALLVWLIVSQSLAALTLVLWVVMAGLSFMAFDSGVTWQATVFVVLVCAYPLVPLVFSIFAWVFYSKRRLVTALVLTTIPLLPAALMVAVYAGVDVFGLFGK